jgi:hypothetical protein
MTRTVFANYTHYHGLLASGLDQKAAERAICRLLGLHFGFLGGYSEDGIGLLWQKLTTQPPCGRIDAAQQSGVPACNAEPVGVEAACMSAALPGTGAEAAFAEADASHPAAHPCAPYLPPYSPSEA